MDCNFGNNFLKIDLTSLCVAQSFAIINLDDEDPIKLEKFSVLIKEQWEKKSPYRLALVQDTNGMNLHIFDSFSICNLKDNPMTNAKITNIFIFNVNPPDHPLAKNEFLLCESFEVSNLERKHENEAFPIPPKMDLIQSVEEVDQQATGLEFDISPCFAPLTSRVIVNLEDVEFFSGKKYGELIAFQKSQLVPFCLAIVQDEKSMQLSCFNASLGSNVSNLQLKKENPQTKNTIANIFYYSISGNENIIESLGHLKAKTLMLELHLKAINGCLKSQFELGEYFEKKDLQKAFSWYYAAAQKGFIPAKFCLALAYMEGLGTLKDIENASKIFASIPKNEEKYKDAQFHYGVCQFELKNYKVAKSALNNLLAFKDYYKAMQVKFYFASCHFELNEFEPAEKIFESIVSNKSQCDSSLYTKAQFQFAMCLHKNPTKKKLKKAEGILKLVANSDNADIQYNLGFFYQKNSKVENALKMAFICFQRAADRGVAKAQYELGLCYDNGRGVEKDLKMAFTCYQRAADQGCAEGQCSLGVCYNFGKGVEKDFKMAFTCFQRAADQGFLVGHYSLGVCYRQGLGVEQDLKMAFTCFQRVADHEVAFGQHALGVCYKQGEGVEKDLKMAFTCFQQAADQGDRAAQHEMGLLYLNGIGVAKNLKMAFTYFQQAANQGSKEAQYQLGICYKQGLGVEKNLQKSVNYFQQAASQGHQDAKAILNSIPH